MKKLVIILSIVLNCSLLISQTCYSVLGDYSGFQNTESLNELTARSCELIDSFPSRFSQNFGVFDFGFYPINEYKEDGFLNDWEDARKRAADSKTFYLLIGREASSNGIYTKIHIDLKFPKTYELDCVKDEQIAFLRFQIEKSVNAIKEKSLLEIESTAIDMLKEFVVSKVECCSQGNRNYCGECLDNEDFIEYLSDNKFLITPVQTLTKVNFTNMSSTVKEYAQLNFSFEGAQVDVNQEIKELVSDLTELTDNVLAEISYYDSECEATFNLVENNPFQGSENPYVYIKVIGVNSLLGDKITIKVESNLFQGKGKGTLYILNLNSGYETAQIINSTQYFFDLAGLKIKLKAITKLEKIGDYDGIAIIGNLKSKVGKFVFGNDILLSALNEYEPCETFHPDFGLASWYLHPEKNNPEKASNKISLFATSDLSGFITGWNSSNDDNKLFGINGVYRLLGYILLHVTSHNAGFFHDLVPNDPRKTGLGYNIRGFGYANSGYEHKCFLNREHCPNSFKSIKTFEDIIEWTKEDFGYIITQTNVRYGY